MKNVILGIIGCFVIIYTTLLSLEVYSINVRKNEIDKSISYVLQKTMRDYYQKYELCPRNYEISDSTVTFEVTEEIKDRLKSDSEKSIDVIVCDMNKGIISVRVTEKFLLPAGQIKEISCKKTVIFDKSIEEI